MPGLLPDILRGGSNSRSQYRRKGQNGTFLADFRYQHRVNVLYLQHPAWARVPAYIKVILHGESITSGALYAGERDWSSMVSMRRSVTPMGTVDRSKRSRGSPSRNGNFTVTRLADYTSLKNKVGLCGRLDVRQGGLRTGQ